MSSVCIHHRNLVTHDRCAAGIVYRDLTGADKDGLPKRGLSCWFDEGTLCDDGVTVRVVCPMKETREGENT